jgi:hypothetical protein
MRHDTLAIGCAAGFDGDRTDVAAPIVEMLIARGGASILSDRLVPFANTGHGAWEHRNGNGFLLTFIGNDFNAMGNFLGTLKIRNKLTVTGPDTLTAPRRAMPPGICCSAGVTRFVANASRSSRWRNNARASRRRNSVGRRGDFLPRAGCLHQ